MPRHNCARLWDGYGVDIVLDIVGGNYFKDNIRLLAPDGRLCVVGVLGGADAQLNLGRVLTKRLTITGSTLRARSPEEKGAIALALQEWVWPLLDAGKLTPVIQASFPLHQAAEAHRIMEANEAMGKLVLTTGH
jgi:NADPH2:quinone reductase